MRVTIPKGRAGAFRTALEALNEAGFPYVVGGAFAMHHYTGVWRNTNDLDVYLERAYVAAAVDALSRRGFRDYGEMATGDREWIHHAVKDKTLVDLIWQPPNHLRPVDESMYAGGEDGVFLGVPVRFMPVEDLVWAKIFTMNRHRCDWPDVFQIVRGAKDRIDWKLMIAKMEEHWPVLLAFVVLFDWVYPREPEVIPDTARRELLKRKLELRPSTGEATREAILDPWVYTRPAGG